MRWTALQAAVLSRALWHPAAKAAIEKMAVIAALKRCVTQKQMPATGYPAIVFVTC
jgi:hypothetical protein